MKVCTACTALTALLIAMPISMAQDASRRIARGSPGSCPGGKAVVGDIELAAIPLSLDQLVRMSQLIIVEGTVIAVLPSINSNPSFASSVETDSLISVEQVLYGTLPTGLHTVALAQQGGTTAQCELVVPVDPLVKQNEQYFLFLWPDNRKAEPPNASGAPRYYAVGMWSGKAKIENGKVQFLPTAKPALHKYDNSGVSEFVSTLKARVSILFPKK